MTITGTSSCSSSDSTTSLSMTPSLNAPRRTNPRNAPSAKLYGKKLNFGGSLHNFVDSFHNKQMNFRVDNVRLLNSFAIFLFITSLQFLFHEILNLLGNDHPLLPAGLRILFIDLFFNAEGNGLLAHI